MRSIALLALFAAAVIAVPGTASSQDTVQLYRRKYVKDSDRDVDSSTDDRNNTSTTPSKPGDKYDGNKPGQPGRGGKDGKGKGRFFRRLMRNDKFRTAFWKWWKDTGRQYADEVIKEIKDEGGNDHDSLPGHSHNDGHAHDHDNDHDNRPGHSHNDGHDHDDNNSNNNNNSNKKKYDDKDNNTDNSNAAKNKRTYTRN